MRIQARTLESAKGMRGRLNQRSCDFLLLASRSYAENLHRKMGNIENRVHTYLSRIPYSRSSTDTRGVSGKGENLCLREKELLAVSH
jgi:hypothetical protein